MKFLLTIIQAAGLGCASAAAGRRVLHYLQLERYQLPGYVKSVRRNAMRALIPPIAMAAVGVAAHECGHAIQHQQGYVPLTLRSAIVPVANLGSTLAWPLILIGLFFTSNTGTFLIDLGILCFSCAVLFQLVTLPVEFNASRRAMAILEGSGYLYPDELKGARSVLTAAAMTYVAAMVSASLQLLRLVLLFGNRRR